MTKTLAKKIVEREKNNTAYFDESMTRDQMYAMLRERMRFGIAETEVIIASLIIAGAKFKD
ncbi:MAG: hypothetical protein J6R59_10725 [Paludibacteraceae bacterium]|nr:hypothetical protein [Paludibacteraceae bacterium]